MVNQRYNPLQIPNILSDSYNRAFIYKETFIATLDDFVICMWEMYAKDTLVNAFEHIILPDGCIDLVIDFTNHAMFFSGMSKIEYQSITTNEGCYFGFRMKPGAFHDIFGYDAREAMDTFVNLEPIEGLFDFDLKHAQNVMIEFLEKMKVTYLESVSLFNHLYNDQSIHSVQLISEYLGRSESQTYRYFLTCFGLSPKFILSVIRFQKSIAYLIDNKDSDLSELAIVSGYYDQAHFNRDMRKNMGISPGELLRRYDRNIQ